MTRFSANTAANHSLTINFVISQKVKQEKQNMRRMWQMLSWQLCVGKTREPTPRRCCAKRFEFMLAGATGEHKIPEKLKGLFADYPTDLFKTIEHKFHCWETLGVRMLKSSLKNLKVAPNKIKKLRKRCRKTMWHLSGVSGELCAHCESEWIWSIVY